MAETAVAKAQPSQKAVAVKNFQAVMNNSYYQSLLQSSLKENKGAFCTSLMEIFSSDEKLLQCKPNDLMAEALKAASLRLPLNKQLGQAYLLPFKNKGVMTPTLVIGTKGYLQLAMRTGKYETINADVVYEGEFNHYDKVTGKLDLSGAQISNTPIGYFAYFKKKDGLTKLLYMTLDEVCRYAKQYSPTVKFSEKVDAEKLKEMALKQAANGSGEGVDGIPTSKVWPSRLFSEDSCRSGENSLSNQMTSRTLMRLLLPSFSVMKSLPRQRMLSPSAQIPVKS